MVSFRYLTLHVEKSRLREIAEWYVSRIGLSILWGSADFVMLGGKSGARIGFHSGQTLAEPYLVQLPFRVENVDETYRQLRAQGVAFEEEPHGTDWGYRLASLSDPAGHRVEIYTEMAAAEQGSPT